jgi:hypothetical protein
MHLLGGAVSDVSKISRLPTSAHSTYAHAQEYGEYGVRLPRPSNRGTRKERPGHGLAARPCARACACVAGVVTLATESGSGSTAHIPLAV